MPGAAPLPPPPAAFIPLLCPCIPPLSIPDIVSPEEEPGGLVPSEGRRLVLGPARNPAQPQHLFLLPMVGLSIFGAPAMQRGALWVPFPWCRGWKWSGCRLCTRGGQDPRCSLAVSPPAGCVRSPWKGSPPPTASPLLFSLCCFLSCLNSGNPVALQGTIKRQMILPEHSCPRPWKTRSV